MDKGDLVNMVDLGRHGNCLFYERNSPGRSQLTMYKERCGRSGLGCCAINVHRRSNGGIERCGRSGLGCCAINVHRRSNGGIELRTNGVDSFVLDAEALAFLIEWLGSPVCTQADDTEMSSVAVS